jgi:hypothetical protein
MLTHDLFYVVVRQRSSGGVYTFEDRRQERRSRTNIVDGDDQSRPEGHVVEHVNKGKYSTSIVLHTSGV